MTAPDLAAAKSALRRQLRSQPRPLVHPIGLQLPTGWPRPELYIAGYWPVGCEPDLRAGLARLRSAGCHLCLPRIDDQIRGLMEFHDWSAATALAHNRYGIAEPVASLTVDVAAIGLMLIPGLAFSRCGARLGTGAGYYDRYLSRPGFRALTIGVCLGERVYAELPSEAHDLRVQYLLTERGLQPCAVG